MDWAWLPIHERTEVAGGRSVFVHFLYYYSVQASWATFPAFTWFVLQMKLEAAAKSNIPGVLKFFPNISITEVQNLHFKASIQSRTWLYLIPSHRRHRFVNASAVTFLTVDFIITSQAVYFSFRIMVFLKQDLMTDVGIIFVPPGSREWQRPSQEKAAAPDATHHGGFVVNRESREKCLASLLRRGWGKRKLTCCSAWKGRREFSDWTKVRGRPQGLIVRLCAAEPPPAWIHVRAEKEPPIPTKRVLAFWVTGVLFRVGKLSSLC